MPGWSTAATYRLLTSSLAVPPATAALCGFMYGPFRDGEDPTRQIFPTSIEIDQDLAIAARATAAVGLYSTDHGFAQAIALGAQHGVIIIPGCFLNNSSNDDEEVGSLISTLLAYQDSYFLPYAMVGSEAVSEQGLTTSQLISRISQVRSGAGDRVPIATAEFWGTWLNHPELAAGVDVLLVNVYPYYEGVAVDQAADYAVMRFRQVQAQYPNLPCLIGETGWPSEGETYGAAVAGIDNQQAYLAQVLRRAFSGGIGMFIFELFDESWKIAATNTVNQGHFGILTSQRNGTSGTPKGAIDDNFITGPILAGSCDLDGDGQPDILWQEAGGQVAAWLLNGTTIQSAPLIGGNPGPSWRLIGSADLNGDHRPDLLWQNDNGQPAAWLLNGTSVTGTLLVGANPGSAWRVAGLGDFNQDGRVDLLWQHESGQPALWLLSGITVAAAPLIGGNPGPEWRIVGVGDFNGDGRPDLVWQHDSGQPAAWLLNGSTVTSALLLGANPGASWRIVAVADFSGDGRPDLLWQHNDGFISIWLMDGLLPIAASLVGVGPDPWWRVVGVGDLNGDGRPDLLLQHHSSGELQAWLLDGWTLVQIVSLPPTPGANWRVKAL